jgi:hypothetical protein
VALKHYLQKPTVDDCRKAAGKAAQKAAQYPPESGSPEQKAETADVQKDPDLLKDSEPYENVHKSMVGDTGLEQPAERPANPQVSETGGAESGASGAVSAPAGPDVADLARRLAALPSDVLAGIVAMVKAASETPAK